MTNHDLSNNSLVAASSNHHIPPQRTARHPVTMVTLAMLKAQEVLVRYTDDFQKDFDFDDVVDDVRRYVLTDAECADILSHAHSAAEQIDKLIFVLSTSAHKLGEFINAIEEKYCWLAQRMRSALQDDSKDAELDLIRQKIQELRGRIPRLEAFNVQRKHYVSVVWRIIYVETNCI